MKKVYLCLIALTVMTTAFGQGNFEKGDNVINAGIGFGSSLLSVGSGYSQSPAISASFEHGIWEIGGPGVISLGGLIGYKAYKYDYDYLYYGNYQQKWTYTLIGFRGAYHFNGIKSDKFDVYGGVMVSYRIITYTDNNSNAGYSRQSYPSEAGGSLFVVGRYYVSPNFGFYGELSHELAYLNVGLSFKF